jgi:redox-sensitive bicupin YhaK (pirin superfamily)
MLGRRRFVIDTALAGAAVSACRGVPALLDTSFRPVTQVVPGLPTVDGAGVHLTRIIGHADLRHRDPFVLLDRIHSNDPAAYIKGFPDHPHRGFETVTVMLDGRMRHRDSRGNHGVITGGGAQWMTAGRGIVHSEMPEQDTGWISGFQFWINLPAAEKMCPQEYQDLQPSRLAEERLSSAGSVARVIAGRADGLVGPVHQRTTEPLLLTLALEDDRPFEVDVASGHEAFVFVHAGELAIGAPSTETTASEGTLALLGEGRRIRLRAPNQRSVAIVAAARPLHEPIVQRGPFVMNTDAEINQAIEDYHNGVLDEA